MKQKLRKNHKLYLFLGLYTAVISTAWVIGGFYTFIRIVNGHREPAILGYLVYFLIPIFPMFANLGAFPLEYSIFGQHDRFSFPNEVPIYVERWSSGRIGYTRGFHHWLVYPSGLGIAVWGAWKAFIPFSTFQRIEEILPYFKFSMVHKHDEIRDPIWTESQDLYLCLKKQFNEYQENSKRGVRESILN